MAPARIGDAVTEVGTPALLFDLDVAERNIVKLQEMTAGTQAVPRPHAKSTSAPTWHGCRSPTVPSAYVARR